MKLTRLAVTFVAAQGLTAPRAARRRGSAPCRRAVDDPREVELVALPIDGSTAWNFAWTSSRAADDAAPWPAAFAPGQLAAELRYAQAVPVASEAFSAAVPWPAIALTATVPTLWFALFRFLSATGLGWLAEGGPVGWIARLPSAPGLVAAAFAAAAPPAAAQVALHCVLAPAAHALVFRALLLEGARRARLPYGPSVLVAALVAAPFHDCVSPETFALAAYWGHLYAQTRNVLIPFSMHAIWNAVALTLFSSSFLV